MKIALHRSARALLSGIVIAVCITLAPTFALAAGVSNYTKNKIVDHTFRATTWTSPTTICVALLTAPASASSTGATIAEAAYTGYARAQLDPSVSNWKSTNGATSGASSGTAGTTSNAVQITFGTPPTSGPTVVTDLAILDSCTVGAGNVLFFSTLTASKTINNGDPAPIVPVDAIVVRPTE